jgi:Ca2+/Na+ antiporter
MKNRLSSFLPVLLLFIFLNAFFIVGKNLLSRWNADQEVLIIGNLLLFVITVITFFLAIKAMDNPNPQVFIRSVYGSIMIKMFICIIAALIYIATFKTQINKPALFTCMGLYLVYTFIEVSIVTKLLKHQKING